MRNRRVARILGWIAVVSGTLVLGHPYPGYWNSGAGAAIHYQPVAWPSEPAAASCGDTCGNWKPYTRFGRSITDPRVQDPSNGGTAPQNYVNISSSCSDKTKPSIYYYLYRGATPANDVVMFRWRVEQPAHTYATAPSAGNYGSSDPWSSAQWTVMFNTNGSGYRNFAAHLNGSSGAPATPVDLLAGIWSNTNSQSIDYANDPNVHILAHNPTAFIGPTNKLMNFHSSLSPDESWPNGASETVWDYGTTRAELITNSPCNEYFIDYQIPVAMLDATSAGGPAITRDTPIAMLFCTANSLSNPFQKDCAINRTWGADASNPAPFGDFLSFNKSEPYQQPIITSVKATAPLSCPGTYTLTTTVQDALAVQSGVVVNTIKSVYFYYWYDLDGDGNATASDTGSSWTRIATPASLVTNTLNTFTLSWDATSLPKGKYLIGVQAVDDASLVDDGMTPTGVDNRTFSYLSGDSENKIYINGAWITGQQAAFPSHSPFQTPGSSENWYGNPSVTGVQVAIVGTAINACGVAPTLTLSATPGNVATGGTVGFTMTVTNPVANSSSITVSSVSDTLPTGFSYTNNTSSGTGGLPSTNPTVSGQVLTWTLGSPISLSPGSSATLSFSTTASNAAGTYSSSAGASTSFGSLTSNAATVVVDSARVSLAMTPSTYSIAADGSTQLVYSLRYSNDSSVAVTSASISDALPAGTTYVSCSGGSSCSNTAGTITWSLGTINPGVSGTVTLTITVPNSYSSASLSNSATLSVTAPDNSTVTANASTTVAVTGGTLPGSASFSLTKTANVTTVAPSGTVIYTIAYSNYGNQSASSVVISDPLPSGFTYSSCTGGCSNSSNTITWNIGTVAAGGSGSVTVTATVAGTFTYANPAVNTASINWTGGSTVTSSASVGVTGQSCSTYYFRNSTANVGFDGTKKIANVSPALTAGDTGTSVSVLVPAGGSGRTTFTEVLRFYQDPATAADVPFNGNITSTIYIDRNPGQALTVRTTVYDYNSTSGATTQLGQGSTTFNGSSVGLVSVTVTPSGTLAKNHRLLWVYDAQIDHNSATATVQFQYAGTVANTYSSGSTFANANANYCITPPANLTLTSTVSSASITESTTPTLTYTLKYANTGSASATTTTLVGALPSNFTSCQYSTNGSTWNTCSTDTGSSRSNSFSLGTVAGGGSGTVYVRGVVPSGTTAPSTLTSTSTISSDQTSALNASASTTVITAAAAGTPALTLNMSANRSNASPGTTVTYTLTVINTGTATATNVIVSDTVPATAYYTYTSCTGSCGVSGSTLTWPTISSLAAGATQSYTYTMTVGTSGLPAGVTNISDTSSASGDSGLTATSNNVTVAMNGNPSLVLLNTPSPSSGLNPGDTITYTLTLANTGAADASNVVISNPIPANTTFAGNITATQGSGSFDLIGNRVLFDVGTLTSGGSVTLTFQVTVNTPLSSGATVITSTATADASNASEQVTAANATANAAPTLVITKSAPTSVAYPSAVLTAAASGTTLFVDRTDRLQVNQLIKIGSQVTRIVSLSAKSILVNSSVTASSGTAVNGAMTIDINYSNTGNAAATGTTIREALAAGFGYYSTSPSASSTPSAGSSGNVDWTIGTLAAGASGTVQVTTFPTGSTGSFTNTSTLAATNAITATTNSVTMIGGLTVTKSSSTPVVSAGGTATYSIVVSNSLGVPVSSVTVTDKLPAGMTYKLSSATVGGVTTEPTFDVSDTSDTQPIWSGVTIPANGSLTINFQTNVANSLGAGTYQNELTVDAPAGVGVMNFDPLLTTAEDVNVLAAATGVVKGYVFSRPSGGALTFDPVTDTPLTGVRVEIHKAGADCNNPVGGNCVVVYTDSNGYFEHSMAAEQWIVSVIQNTGDLPSAWYQVAGTNDNTVTVPDQSVVWDYNGFSVSAPTTHTVSTSAGANGGISPTSATVNDGSTTSFTITPNSGYSIASAAGCSGSLSGNTYTTAAITADCTVSATFSLIPPVTHTVTASAGTGGSVSPTSATVNDGSTTTVTVTADANYSIAGVTGCGGNLSGNTYTTGSITADCTVTASFNPIIYFVSTSAGTGGSISPAGITVISGNTTSFTVTPDSGYSISSVSGCGGSLSGNTYTTGVITGACTVSATFILNSIPSYLVSTSAGSGGSISPASTLVTDGNTTSFTVTPNTGYSIASVSGCGGGLSGNTYTTGIINGACAVTATFSLNSYTVSAIAGSGGSASPSSQGVSYGSTTTVTVTANSGYSISSATGCGGSLSGNTYTTAVITGACTVNASFIANSPTNHTVTASAGSGGTITPSSATVADGSTTSFTVTPNTGYSINSVTGCSGSLSGNTYTTGTINADCSVNATFSLNSYTVSAAAGTGGSVSPMSQTVSYNNTATITVTPNSGYTISAVTGCGGALSGNTYATAAITGACTVNASFITNSPTNHTVSTSAGTGGSISPTSATVSDGSTTSFTITPNTGYVINTVTGCGGSLSGNTYTTGAIAGACTVTASFNLNSFTVTATAGTGGIVSPTSQTISQGNTAIITVTPDTGYSINNVTGCGGSLSGNTYTTGAITGACTVNATFSLNSYTVTASAGTGGNISPASTQVNHGQTTSFTVTPSTSYAINTVTGCGGSLAGNTYTTGIITSACTVNATFRVIAPVFDPAPPATLYASSLFTDVPTNIKPRAVDGNGNALIVTLVGSTKLQPGRHTLTWTATDSLGNTMTTTQQLDIWPTVSLSQDLTVPFGSAASFNIVLNGDAPQYPFNVDYTVTGGGLNTLHNLASGTATFASGTEASVYFNALPQGTSMPPYPLTVTLNPASYNSEHDSLKITLVSINVAPVVQIVVTQSGRTGTTIARDGGPVTLHAVTQDANPLDTHTYDWKYPLTAVVQISPSGTDLTLNPSNLTGLQSLDVVVTDSGTPAKFARAGVLLAIKEASTSIVSGDNNNNGIPDTVDAMTLPNVLPEDLPVINQYLVEGTPDSHLRIGGYSQLHDSGVRLLPSVVPQVLGPDVVENVGGTFDLQAVDVDPTTNSITAVIPQRQPIPQDALYRLWDSQKQQWTTFTQDSGNTLSSAPGEAGFCPPPGSSAYTPGLTAGNLCVEVTAVDGGPNDFDGQRNSVMSLTGGVAQRTTSIVTGSSSGGGGAMGWMTCALAIIALLRCMRLHLRMGARWLLVLMCGVPLISNADEICTPQMLHCYYVGIDVGVVHNQVDASEMDARLSKVGYTTSTSMSGQTRIGGEVMAGYRWEKWSAELAYANLGRIDTVISGTTPIDAAYLHAISVAHPRSGEGFKLAAMYHLPINEKWEGYVRGGAFYWRNTQRANSIYRDAMVKDRKLDPFLGFGIQYRPIKNKMSISGELSFHRLDGETVSMLGFSLRYRVKRFW